MDIASRHAWLLAIGATAACAGHRVAHIAPDESRPHITWEIRAGGGTDEGEMVCGSRQPSRDCVLAASSTGSRSLTTVHLYLHAAREPTRYLGVMQVPFIEGSNVRKDREVSVSVPPDSQPVGVTVTGRLTTKPGKYTFRISLDATQAEPGTRARIEENATVLVK